MEIREDDLAGPEIRTLLALHLEDMRAHSPPGGVYALDLSGLTAPEVTVWTAWKDGDLLGCAALKVLAADHGEIKSMRTHPAHLRKGVAAALLERVIDAARARGLRRLSLETGSGPAFDAALAFYRGRGFENGPAFGGYEPSAFNQFLHLKL